jgi:hypothetical protein
MRAPNTTHPNNRDGKLSAQGAAPLSPQAGLLSTLLENLVIAIQHHEVSASGMSTMETAWRAETEHPSRRTADRSSMTVSLYGCAAASQRA